MSVLVKFDYSSMLTHVCFVIYLIEYEYILS